MPKFKRLGSDRFACVECGAIHEGAFAKQDVLACARRHVNGICDTPHYSFNPQSRPGYGDTLQRGDGYTRPDKSGRWRLGKNAFTKKMIAYSRAVYKLTKAENSVQNFMENFFVKDNCYPRWAERISPLQRLSHAYLHLGWEAVKQAAYALAYDMVVREQINAYFAHVADMTKQVDGFLAEMQKEAFEKGEVTDLIVDPADLNMN